MRFNKFVGTIAAATISLAAMSGVAQANTTMASFGGSTPVLSDITFTSNGAGGGTLVTTAGGSVVDITSTRAGAASIPAFFTFGPINLNSTTALGGGLVQANFGGGTFSLGTVAGGNDLLAGTFGGANLFGGPGSATTFVANNNITYTSGTLRTLFLSFEPGPFVIGNFTLGLNALSAPQGAPTPIGIGAGGGLGSFTASTIAGNFDAISVPEPSEWLAMGMAATSVGGLMFRAKLKLRAKRQQVAA